MSIGYTETVKRMTTYFKQRMAEIDADRKARGDELVARMQREARAAQIVERTAESNRGYVYILKSGNAVKIGFTRNPKNRKKAILTGCSEPGFICKVVLGGRATERHFHERFSKYRLRGEWFDLRGRLAKYLERCVRAVEMPEPKPEPEIRISLA